MLPWGRRTGGGIGVLFVDEDHFRSKAKLRGKWMLRGEPALVDWTSPQYWEKAGDYSASCLETGEVGGMEIGGQQ